MRLKSRTDRNQPEIVATLRKMGCSVCCLHALGNGVPDLLVGYKGLNYLIEVKDGSKPPSARKLTPDEAAFFKEWKGQVTVVTSVEEAIATVTGIPVTVDNSRM